MISPSGERIIETGPDETTAEARIDPSTATRAREGFPLLGDTRYTVTLE